MGLDAVVYIHYDNLKFEIDPQLVEIDKDTGEVIIEQSCDKIEDGELIAISERLGNVDKIRFLRNQIKNASPCESSILLTQILYSSSHCGDIIEISMLDGLEAELDCLENNIQKISQPEVLLCFIDVIKKLITHARKQKNPIVFV